MLKKAVASSCDIQLLFALPFHSHSHSHSQARASKTVQDAWIDSVVSPVTADGRPNGSVFIGTSSEEVTGTTYHVHSAFYPTIERVKLDFEDRMLGHWNKELLTVAGSLSRSVYDHVIENYLSQHSRLSAPELADILRISSPSDQFNTCVNCGVQRAPFRVLRLVTEPLNGLSLDESDEWFWKAPQQGYMCIHRDRCLQRQRENMGQGVKYVCVPEELPEEWLLALVGIMNIRPETRETKVNQNLVRRGFLSDAYAPCWIPISVLEPADSTAVHPKSLAAQTTTMTARRKLIGFAPFTAAYRPTLDLDEIMTLPSIHSSLCLHGRFDDLWEALVSKGLRVMNISVLKNWLMRETLAAVEAAAVLKWWCRHMHEFALNGVADSILKVIRFNVDGERRVQYRLYGYLCFVLRLSEVSYSQYM